jgi:hypothetical protein
LIHTTYRSFFNIPPDATGEDRLMQAAVFGMDTSNFDNFDASVICAPVRGLARVLVSHADISMLLLKQLTALEAGRLGGACRWTRLLMLRGEADEERAKQELHRRHKADMRNWILHSPPLSNKECFGETLLWAEKQRVFLPMWDTDAVLARLERYRQPYFEDGGLQFKETTGLARLMLDELLPQGVIRLEFKFELARAGKAPSLLGCHKLDVIHPDEWIRVLESWAQLDESHLEVMDQFDHDIPCVRERYPGSYIIDLLRHLGLKPGTREPEQMHDSWPAHWAKCKPLCVRDFTTF